jgi:hypothetical protein
MSLILDGTNGLSDVDGSAATPAIRGSDANTGIFFPAADTIAFAEGGAEAMRIDSSGNVGIGTTVPFSNLSIVGATGAGYQQLKLRQTDTAADQRTGIAFAEYATGTQGFGIGAFSDSGVNRLFIGGGANGMNSATEIRFATTSAVGTNIGTERARIDSSGNVNINTTSNPVYGSTSARLNILKNTGQYSINSTTPSTGNEGHITFRNPNGIVGEINTNGSSTSYVTSSDYRLKHDIQPMTGALAKVAQLKPVTYKWNINDSESQGFIAHELQEVVPECVTGEKDAVDAEGNPQYQGIDTSFLAATLTAAIQELKGINDAQAQIITALTARVEALEGAQA